MIGDWTESIVGDKWKISEVTDNYAIGILNGVEAMLHKFEDEYYNPVGIEITKEFLDNNGFRFERDYGAFWRSMLGDIYFKSEFYVNVEWLHNCGDYKIVYVECVKRSERKESGVTLKNGPFYVHDLQHALRLVGLGDIADNFKL